MTDVPAEKRRPRHPVLGILSFLARRSPLALGLVAMFVLAAILGPFIASYSMTDTNLAMSLQGPSAQHWLGTDPLGRDVLSRLLGASRVAAQAFLIVVVIGGGNYGASSAGHRNQKSLFALCARSLMKALLLIVC